MDSFREQVKKGFQACKADIQALNASNSSVKDQLSNVQEENRMLKEQLESMNSILVELRNEMKNLSKPQAQDIKPTREPLYKAAKAEPTPPQDPYEALLAFKAKSNKREVIKQKMTTMLGENGMQLSELKFMIVEHFRYCSKATFYNYLKELELERIVKIEREHSKNVVVPYSLVKEI